jgi:hypothetical protein
MTLGLTPDLSGGDWQRLGETATNQQVKTSRPFDAPMVDRLLFRDLSPILLIIDSCFLIRGFQVAWFSIDLHLPLATGN